MMGLHPCYVKPESWEKELEIVKNYLDQRHFPAIGEIGIDLYWDKTTLDIQVKAFEQQIDWAIEKIFRSLFIQEKALMKRLTSWKERSILN